MKLLIGLGGTLLAIAPAYGQKQKQKQKTSKQPNVIFIYADDLGYGDLECYGAKNVHTPNVNRLAESGVRFTNGHARQLLPVLHRVLLC